MCGIAGYTGSEDEKIIHDMSGAMAHRGPDGEGFYKNDDVSLVNRRLAIIDRMGGDQPLYNEDKSLVIVYNGEIYNYKELRVELKKTGHTFRTASDTEVIVHGYEEWGASCFDRLNGMFGIALYDIKKKELVLARDHFGIKPVYFFEKDRSVFFASEIKTLLATGLINPKVHEETLYRYLQYRVQDDTRYTFFEGVHRLLPGEFMVVSNGKAKIDTYSTLTKENILKENNGVLKEEDIATFRNFFIKSVEMRLQSEVPVGTALSGGLDSSTVVSVINTLLKNKSQSASSVGAKQNTFSAVFPGASNDEEKYIDDLLSESQNISSHKVYPKPEDLFVDLQDFVRTQEEPTISTGPYAQYQVMKEASKHVTVLLDGQGADEMMAGYLPYYFVFLKSLTRKRKYGAFLKEVLASRDILLKFAGQVFSNKLNTKKTSLVKLLSPEFANKFLSSHFHIENYDLKKRLYQDIFQNSLQSLLRYEDRNTMRFSLEGRVPFLDKELLKYLFSLPNSAIINNGWNKNILRKAFSKDLPNSIASRRNKIGFTTPEYEWFMRMKNKIYGIFMSESFAGRKYFNKDEVVRAFERFIQGQEKDTMIFWRILNVELWLREFIDEKIENEQVKKDRGLLDPNDGKSIEITFNENEKYERYPIKTDLVQSDTDIYEFVTRYTTEFIDNFKKLKSTGKIGEKWYLIISEKIVAISQGRSFFLWDIHPSYIAKILSKFVTRTPYGIGLGSPWTMQIAIDEVGLLRIVAASLISVITKPFGMKGLFYRVAGRSIAAIDGPTEYSVYPSNVSAKLAPKNPQIVAKRIADKITSLLPDNEKEMFGGVVIIDANDIGRQILGNSTAKNNDFFESVMKDNPMGQSDEQTPLIILMKYVR